MTKEYNYVETQAFRSPKRLIYAVLIIGTTVLLCLLSYLQLAVVRTLDSIGIGQMEFSHPLVWFRSGLGYLRSWFYLPIVFWLITWIRQRYTDSANFRADWMGKISLLAGAILLLVSQALPPAILESGLPGLGGAAVALYGMGLCLSLCGILCIPTCRTFLLGSHLGRASFAIGFLWIAIGIVNANIALTSLVWPIAYVVSLTLVVLGLLSFRGLERWWAFAGLLLLTISAFGVSPKFRSLDLIMNWRYRTPVDFLSWLSWSVAFGWGLGLFRRTGHPFDSGKKNNGHS